MIASSDENANSVRRRAHLRRYRAFVKRVRFSQNRGGENLRASLQDVRRLFGDVEMIRDGRDISIGVCGFDLENCRRFTQRQAHAAFVQTPDHAFVE